MAETERIREVLENPLSVEELQRRQSAGWRAVAVEWERGGRLAAPAVHAVPYGLKIADDHCHLVEHEGEIQVLLGILEGIVEDRSMAEIAATLNGAGLRMRSGEAWTQTGVFALLPRITELAPRLYAHESWAGRRRRLRGAPLAV